MPQQDDQAQVSRFYNDLRQQLLASVEAQEEGGTLEEHFTQEALNLLEENGETENARECREIREDKRGYKIHKINGYALSESYENLDLFITIYQGYDDPQTVTTADVTAAFNQCRKFLNSAIKGHWTEMEPAAPAFNFAREIHKNSKEIVRARLFLLTDGECKATPPAPDLLPNTELRLTYHLVDIGYLTRLDGGQPAPIAIDFEKRFGGAVPCLSIPSSNDSYQAYLAVIPGKMLADIYEEYGPRLLEMNVRSFLQSNGKINKGIRQTIMHEPHMFLAFNNGIAATAEEVEIVDIPGNGKGISSVKELQIVNGGQTTASIFHTRRKDKADVSEVFVQVKLSVIKNHDNIGKIVNLISRYANSQNKVSDADLTANSPFHTEVERLSRRMMWAPPQENKVKQTRWFYERARGQYKNALAKEGAQSFQREFKILNPPEQMFVKEELAKYYNVWNMLPWFVVQGNQKNYTVFMNGLEKNKVKADSVFFEDLIAKAILFRRAEKIYGVKPNAIGDMRYITVPYALAYLNHHTNYQLDLYAIWKRQNLSAPLVSLLRDLMEKIEQAIKANAPGSLYGEWAKREVCWQFIKQQSFPIDWATIKADTGASTRPAPQTEEEGNEAAAREAVERLRSIPAAMWQRIETWGRDTGHLTLNQQNIANGIKKVVAGDRKSFYDKEIDNGPEVLKTAANLSPDLFDDLEALIETARLEAEATADKAETAVFTVTHELLSRLFEWERKHKILTLKEVEFVKTLLKEKVLGNAYKLNYARQIVLKAERHGLVINI